MSRSSGQQVQTQTNSTPQAQYLPDIFNRATNLYGSGGPSYYPGQTHVPFSGETEQALTGIASRAQGGNSLNADAMGLARDTMRGDYLNNNPYLDQVYGRASRGVTRNFNESVMPGVNATFSRAGRFGSNAHQNTLDQASDTLGRSLGEMGADIYGGNYQQERGRQLLAASAAPHLAYADFDRLADVGRRREGLSERALGGDIARHNFNQERPYNALSRYLAALQGNYGSTQTAARPLYRNQAAGVLGGAAAGGGIAKNLGFTGGQGLGLAGLGGVLGGFL
jgi:hypothetical protein